MFTENEKVQCVLADWTYAQLEIEPHACDCPLKSGEVYTVAFSGGFEGTGPDGRYGWWPVVEVHELPGRVFAAKRFRKLPKVEQRVQIAEFES